MKTILVASVGGSPQVVTETLWALMNPERLLDVRHRDRPPIFPDSIHLVATSFIADREQNIRDRIDQLYRSANRRINPDKVDFEIVTDEAGSPIDDIRTEVQNIAYANHITRLIKRLVDEDPDNITRIHMSLAGGRKTMSSYDQSAMMYFGRVQDELSHVLVSPIALEGCRDFWWPGQPALEVANWSGIKFPTDVEAAFVDLVPVPFARLKVPLPPKTTPGVLDHRLLTQWVEAALSADCLEIDLEKRRITYGGDEIKLSPAAFALYATMAVAQVEAWSGAGPFGLGHNSVGWLLGPNFYDPDSPQSKAYCEIYWKVKRSEDDGDKSAAALIGIEPFLGDANINDAESKRSTKIEKAIGPIRTNLERELERKVENAMLLQSLIPQHGPKNDVRFGLSIPATRIVLKGFGDDELGRGPRRQRIKQVLPE